MLCAEYNAFWQEHRAAVKNYVATIREVVAPVDHSTTIPDFRHGHVEQHCRDVSSWAGSFTGNADAFGLKITSCSNGGDRYSLPATALTNGSIIIHK